MRLITYIYDVLPYFNHHIVNGEVVMISDSNCVNVVQKVVEYLMTGKFSTALHSKGQNVNILESIYNSSFTPTTIDELKKSMIEGEIGIIYCYKNQLDPRGHVFNITKKSGTKLLDGQFGTIAKIGNYKYFEYLKIN